MSRMMLVGRSWLPPRSVMTSTITLLVECHSPHRAFRCCLSWWSFHVFIAIKKIVSCGFSIYSAGPAYLSSYPSSFYMIIASFLQVGAGVAVLFSTVITCCLYPLWSWKGVRVVFNTFEGYWKGSLKMKLTTEKALSLPNVLKYRGLNARKLRMGP